MSVWLQFTELGYFLPPQTLLVFLSVSGADDCLYPSEMEVYSKGHFANLAISRVARSTCGNGSALCTNVRESPFLLKGIANISK